MRLSVIALTAALLATPAFARADDVVSPSTSASSSEVVATAATAPASPNQTVPSKQAGSADVTRWLDQAPPVARLGQDYTDGVIQDAPPPRQIHGEVGFGVGTGGYRDAYGIVNMPIGKASELDVAVEDTQYSKPWKINQRSLAVNLSLGGAPSSAGCDSGFRVGDHFVEPLWATRMRGSALTGDPGCISADGLLHR